MEAEWKLTEGVAVGVTLIRVVMSHIRCNFIKAHLSRTPKKAIKINLQIKMVNKNLNYWVGN